MIEAMACGTPTIALRRGSVPEVMEHGMTGYVVDTMDEAVEAARRVATIDRRRCREVFEKRFGAPRMAREYVAVYDALIRRPEEREYQPDMARA
jgi:glycosyltransferase involved in cell wall biosynthesis